MLAAFIALRALRWLETRL